MLRLDRVCGGSVEELVSRSGGIVRRVMLQAGFVGLPNVGKTTLFNAVTAQSSALIAKWERMRFLRTAYSGPVHKLLPEVSSTVVLSALTKK